MARIHSLGHHDGAKDTATGGPTGHRTRGPADPRTSGPADQRTSGPAVQRSSGPADPRTSGLAHQFKAIDFQHPAICAEAVDVAVLHVDRRRVLIRPELDRL